MTARERGQIVVGVPFPLPELVEAYQMKAEVVECARGALYVSEINRATFRHLSRAAGDLKRFG